MSSAVANFWIAVVVTLAICYALIMRARNQRRRSARASGGGTDGGSEISGTNDGFSFGSWFSSDRSALDGSGNPIDGGSCSFSSDSGSDSGGGDCGGGGDGGGGGGD